MLDGQCVVPSKVGSVGDCGDICIADCAVSVATYIVVQLSADFVR